MLKYVSLSLFLVACVDSADDAETQLGNESETALGNELETALADEKAKDSCAAPAGDSSDETIYGLTRGNQLIRFQSDKCNQSCNVAITGLASGESVVGIDFRPSDLGADGMDDVGALYAVTDASRIYMVDPDTGVANSPVSLKLEDGSPVTLSGTSFGVGFNPVVDRLRVHSDAEQNLRINVETGLTFIDGRLTYAACDMNAGANPDITATGYTNNDADVATGTELYAIDVARDVLIEFGPAVVGVSGPNTGLMLTVGSLGVDAGQLAGFDISNGSGVAYASLSTSASGKSTLYSIDLDTGEASAMGLLADTSQAILGIAVAP